MKKTRIKTSVVLLSTSTNTDADTKHNLLDTGQLQL